MLNRCRKLEEPNSIIALQEVFDIILEVIDLSKNEILSTRFRSCPKTSLSRGGHPIKDLWSCQTPSGRTSSTPSPSDDMRRSCQNGAGAPRYDS